MSDRFTLANVITNEFDEPVYDQSVYLPELRAAHNRLLMTRRQAIIMELGAIEDYLEMPRSIVPRRKREQDRDERKAS